MKKSPEEYGFLPQVTTGKCGSHYGNGEYTARVALVLSMKRRRGHECDH